MESIIDKITRLDQEMMEKHGWYAHCVPSGDGTASGFNYHTHGLGRSYGHLNIQIVLPLKFEQAHGLVTVIVDKIKAGVKFEADVEYSDIMANNYKVKFIMAMECGRPVLRLLIPDVNGEYKGAFANQLEKLDNQEGVEENERSLQID